VILWLLIGSSSCTCFFDRRFRVLTPVNKLSAAPPTTLTVFVVFSAIYSDNYI